MYKLILPIVTTIFALQGCLPVVGGAAATTGVVLTQDKTAGSALDDTAIWTKIKSAFLQKNFNDLFASVDVKVHEGRVLMTGQVSSPELRIEAVKIAWEQAGVTEVINEIQVSEQKNKLSVKEYSIDTWITTQIKTKLLVTKHIRSINYNVETVKGIVYLIGIARTQEELNTVTRIASTVPHVKRVISYVRLKDSPLRSKHN